jgi:transglutaminase/protease-like cytokinesis protein 3
MRSLFLLILSLTATAIAKPRDFSAVDRHALAATAKDEASIESLATYLKQNRPRAVWNPKVHFQTRNYLGDEDTAREIYRWIAEKITYDYKSLGLKTRKRHEASEILKRRFGVCHDYAILYEALAKAAGLEVEYVYGNVFVDGKPAEHAWNAVCIGGEWRMIDSCWAAKNGTWPQFQQEFSSKWFSMSPEQFVESHFPDEWQYGRKPFTHFMKNMDQNRLSQVRRRMGVKPVPRDPVWDDD